jgi:uncharacterized membrane protein HdeD (DUF308 family)
VYCVPAWSLVSGVFEIVAAIHLRKYIEGERLLLLSGARSILFGLALVLVPIAGLLVIAWWVGAYWIVSGAMLLGLAFRMRNLAKHAPPRGAMPV